MARGINNIEEKKETEDKLKEKEEIIYFLKKFGIIILFTIIVFKCIYGIKIIEGQEMYPSLKDGDLAFYYRLNGTYFVNDVVVLKKNKTKYISRIVAREGDVVDITEEGELLINGNVQQEEIYYPTSLQDTEIVFPYEVEEDCVFVLSDYRLNATDSRIFGQVNMKEIKGKVFTVVRRRGI